MRQAPCAKRILAVWIPNWSLARLLNERPELSGLPLAIYERTRGVRRVQAVSALAAQRGVRSGMPVAEATALAGRRLRLLERDRFAERRELEELAAWCEQFSPLVGIESLSGRDPDAAPEALLMDVTGLERIFGGEGALARLVVRRFRQRHLEVRVAVADSVGAAWAVSRFALPRRGPATPDAVPRVVPLGQALIAVASLSVEALRLPRETIELLASLGLTTIGQVAALPREGLSARFGPQLLARLDELTGAKAEVIMAHRPPPEFEAEFQLPYPTVRQESLGAVLDQLLARICRMLEARRQGAVRLLCRLCLEDAQVVFYSVGLYWPSLRARHLSELMQMQLQQQRLREPVASIRVSVTATGPLEVQQQELFDSQEALSSPHDNARQRRQLSMLVNRLSSRLGRDAVLGVRPSRDAVPEYACRTEPLVGQVRGPAALPARRNGPSIRKQRAAPEVETSGAALRLRPLWLRPRPEAVTVIAVAPDGPPARLRQGATEEEIVQAWGPERIETLWWRGPMIRRDYYRVETATGSRLWLFRRRNDGQWFLHGEFE